MVALQIFYLFYQPLRLGKVAGVFHHAHRFASALAGTQVFAQAFGVVADQLISAVQNIAVAAVVFFQLDLVLHVVLAYKIGHIAYPRTAKGVDTLVIVTHCKNG